MLKKDIIAVYKKSTQDQTLGKVINILDTDPAKNLANPQALNTIRYVLKHKENVRKRLTVLAQQLLQRAEEHDNSKLQSPEVDWLIEMDKEPRYIYGSPEYLEKKNRWQKFFDHHYEENSHHPEHFKDLGVLGMNLTDLCEYIVDISSYYEDLHPQEVFDLLDKQAIRFDLDFQLTEVLKNTLLDYFTTIGPTTPEEEIAQTFKS